MRRFTFLPLFGVLSILQGQTAPKPAGLRDLSSSFEDLAARVRPAVVQIFSTGYVTPDETESTKASNLLSTQRSTGSGVILTTDGYIITNNHVVDGARKIEVMLQGTNPIPGREVHIPAKLIGSDRQTDLALIKIERTELPFLELGDSNKLRQGQIVMAFGNPLGLEGSVSMGVVSSASRRLRSEDTSVYVQTDAPINPGNSGGPLVNSEGQVVGVNTFILTQSGGSEGLGFAIPSNAVRNVYEQIKKDHHVHHGQIGIVAQTITSPMAKGLELPQDWGAVVADVSPGGPAEKAGVRIRDVIYEANGQTIQDAPQLETMIDRLKVSEVLHLKVMHNDQKLEMDVPVLERPDDSNRFADLVDPQKNIIPRLGILGVEITSKLADMLPELRHQYGVVVAVRSPDPPYSGGSLQLGDVIYQVNRTPVATVKALRDILEVMKPGDTVVLEVQREGKLMYLVIEFE
jgi:serine protease Do